MPLLIDTFNVLHTVGVLPPDLAGIDVQGLIGLLTQSRYRNEKVILACDGKPQPDVVSHEPNVLVRFSGAGKPADDLIGQLVRASTAPRRLIVVSTDHAVQRTARKRRCQVLTSEEFLAQLAEDANLKLPPATSVRSKPPSDQMSSEQVDRWLQVFDLDGDKADQLLRSPVDSPPKRQEAIQEESDEDASSPDRNDSGEIKPVIPPSLIEQAERLWEQQSDSAHPNRPGE